LLTRKQNDADKCVNPCDHTIRYDTIEEFNVDSKAECVQLNLMHVVRKK